MNKNTSRQFITLLEFFQKQKMSAIPPKGTHSNCSNFCHWYCISKYLRKFRFYKIIDSPLFLILPTYQAVSFSICLAVSHSVFSAPLVEPKLVITLDSFQLSKPLSLLYKLPWRYLSRQENSIYLKNSHCNFGTAKYFFTLS